MQRLERRQWCQTKRAAGGSKAYAWFQHAPITSPAGATCHRHPSLQPLFIHPSHSCRLLVWPYALTCTNWELQRCERSGSAHDGLLVAVFEMVPALWSARQGAPPKAADKGHRFIMQYISTADLSPTRGSWHWSHLTSRMPAPAQGRMLSVRRPGTRVARLRCCAMQRQTCPRVA